MKPIHSRMEAVQLPLIPVIGELIRQHPGTISLGQGIVYYPPPPVVEENIAQFFINSQNHQYQSVQGISSLLREIEVKLQQENQIKINQNNAIFVTAGSNMAFMNAILAITNPGDEIILQTPYYFNHEMAIRIANCVPVLVATDENYQLSPEAIANAITDKTKAVVTISPNNPTGVVYSEDSLQKVNQICREKEIYHLSDEAYEYFTYNGVKHDSPGSFADSNTHTISLYSLSKAYGFASWRIGYMVIPKHLIMAVKKIQDTILICPPVISQYAALAALKTGKSYCQHHLQNINKIRNIFLTSLQQIKHLCTVNKADGAFYFFLQVHTEMNAFNLAERLIKEHKIAVIPGTTFGMNDGCYLRVAYGALDETTATEGINRLVYALQAILAG